ncbi:unnamed protein product [Musa textilis]
MASLLSSSAALHHRSLSLTSPSSALARAGPQRLPRIRAVSSAEPQKETPAKSSTEATKTPVPTRSPTSLPKKPVYSMKKGQIVRVDKEKYLNSINYLSVGHPPYYKGLDYIYEDRGLGTPNFRDWGTCSCCLGRDSYCTCMATNNHAYQVGETRLREDVTWELHPHVVYLQRSMMSLVLCQRIHPKVVSLFSYLFNDRYFATKIYVS